jgi:hypothetical protein
MPRQSGPAGARNFASEKARGEVLFFVDADVVVGPGCIDRVAADFRAHPEIDAIFGSYDESPAEKNFVSQYKNLFHHYVHQQSKTEAATFWAGCGAVRRKVFASVGGFNAERYPRPAIEDIELGYRLIRAGHKILLDKELQGKHLKLWTLKSMLQADIFCRAVPWSMLIFESKGMLNDLNLQTTDRLSAVALGLSLALLPVSILKPQLLLVSLLLLALIPLLNYRLYQFFIERRGIKFALMAFPLHAAYYFYSSLTFVICRLKYIIE